MSARDSNVEHFEQSKPGAALYKIINFLPVDYNISLLAAVHGACTPNDNVLLPFFLTAA